MSPTEKAEQQRLLFTTSAVVGVFSILSLLWFMRAHYFNATNAGWGDPEQDHHQVVLGWCVRASAVVAVACAVVAASQSRLALISIATGTAFSGLRLLALAAGWPFIGILGSPGLIAAVFTFGIHSDVDQLTAYIFVVNACAYSGIAFLFVRRKVAPETAASQD